MGESVRLELTGEEALVLFEFLARFDDDSTLSVQDQAEERHCGTYTACSRNNWWRYSTLSTRRCSRQHGTGAFPFCAHASTQFRAFCDDRPLLRPLLQ